MGKESKQLNWKRVISFLSHKWQWPPMSQQQDLMLYEANHFSPGAQLQPTNKNSHFIELLAGEMLRKFDLKENKSLLNFSSQYDFDDQAHYWPSGEGIGPEIAYFHDMTTQNPDTYFRTCSIWFKKNCSRKAFDNIDSATQALSWVKYM